MSYSTVIKTMPDELQPAMFELVEALGDHYREQFAVRREDFDALREVVHELAAAQQRTEVRLEELATAQQRTEVRLEELATAQQRTEVRLEELAAAQQRTEIRLEELAAAQQRTEQALHFLGNKTAHIEGLQLEWNYATKAYAYFGRLLRRAQVVSLREIEGELDARLNEEELQELLPLDLLVQGRVRHLPDTPELWLAIEVSVTVDVDDVRRAQRRAELLRKAGFPAVPAVGGESVTQGAVEACRTYGALLMQDGQQRFWNEALRQANLT
jgi:hypothetical protein